MNGVRYEQPLSKKKKKGKSGDQKTSQLLRFPHLLYKNNCSKMGFRGLSAYHQVVAETNNEFSWQLRGVMELSKAGTVRGAEVILGMLPWAFRNCTICPSFLLGWEEGDGERIWQWNCLCWESAVFIGQGWGLVKRNIEEWNSLNCFKTVILFSQVCSIAKNINVPSTSSLCLP